MLLDVPLSVPLGVNVPELDDVIELEGVTERLAPMLSDAVEEGVGETLEEQVGTSPTLPAGHREGHPHGMQVELEIAPTKELYVPAVHRVQDGTVAPPVEKEPALQGPLQLLKEFPVELPNRPASHTFEHAGVVSPIAAP